MSTRVYRVYSYTVRHKSDVDSFFQFFERRNNIEIFFFEVLKIILVFRDFSQNFEREMQLFIKGFFQTPCDEFVKENLELLIVRADMHERQLILATILTNLRKLQGIEERY